MIWVVFDCAFLVAASFMIVFLDSTAIRRVIAPALISIPAISMISKTYVGNEMGSLLFLIIAFAVTLSFLDALRHNAPGWLLIVLLSLIVMPCAAAVNLCLYELWIIESIDSIVVYKIYSEAMAVLMMILMHGFVSNGGIPCDDSGCTHRDNVPRRGFLDWGLSSEGCQVTRKVEE